MKELALEEIYNEYIIEENDRIRSSYEEKFKGFFSASSAGSCHKKQILKVNGNKGSRPDKRVQRLLRLGTIVHKDFENAITDWADNKLEDKVIKVFSEKEVVIPEINVVGHLDIAIEHGAEVSVYDVKTVASYKWSKQFGWKKNRDKNPSTNYELQLGTYGIGLANELEIEPHKVYLYLAWYNKDNSGMKIKEVPAFWMDNAFEYWTDLIETQEKSENDPSKIMPGTPNVPVMNWECKYCEFKDIFCEGI